MTHDETKGVVKRMVGLFNDMTPEKSTFWMREFSKCEYSLAVANSAIEKAAAEGPYADPQRIFAVLNGFRRKESERKERERIARLKGEEQRIAAEHATAAEAIGELSDEVLAELKADVIALLPSDIRPLYEKRDPRKSKALQLEIYRLVMRGENNVRDPSAPKARALNEIEL